MAQSDFGTIDPTSTSGSQLATLLGNYRNARDSLNSGATAPAYVVKGLLWLDTSATPNILKLYDGAAWATIGSLDPSTSKFEPTRTVSINTQSTAYTVIASDNNKIVDYTGSGATISLTAAATLGSGFSCFIRHSGTGTLVVDPNAAETIEGAATQSLTAGQVIQILCTGTTWKVIGAYSFGTLSSGLAASTDVRSGDGSTTAFTMSGTPSSANTINIWISGVYQQKSTYTWNGSTGITFSTAPPTGTNNIEIVWIAPSASPTTPADASVTTAKIVDANVTLAKMAAGSVDATKLATDADTQRPTRRARLYAAQNLS